MVLSRRVSFGSELLFTKLASSARRRVYSVRPELDTKVPDDTGTEKSLKVLEPQISPSSVPVEKIIFM